jgi:CDP-diacylglycerol--serine O-phosphatidyltransferase
VPRAIWRRRRATDSPRPAGRRWAGRLRRSGSLARQVFLARGVRRRASDAGLGSGGFVGSAVEAPTDPDARAARSTSRLTQAPRLTRLGAGGRGAPSRALNSIRPRSLDLGPRNADLLVPISPAPRSINDLAGDPTAANAPPPVTIPLLPGERTIARRVRFALVNLATIASLLLGMSAIFLAVSGGDLRWAALCLIACVGFDGLDGALARRLGVASPFGAQMDSLADMCSFGIAAPVVVYAWLAGSAPRMLAVPACALVAVCAAIRLARFNVSPKDGRYFCGVPTTLAATVLALGTLIAPSMPPAAQIVAVAVLALAMVSGFPYAKLPRLLRLPPWVLVLPIIGALVDYRVTFAVGVVAYLASGPLLWVRQRQRAV